MVKRVDWWDRVMLIGVSRWWGWVSVIMADRVEWLRWVV